MEFNVKYIKSKLSQTLGILYKARYYLNTESLYLIFHSLFLSRVNYGILCWARCSKTTLQPLITLMNRAIRCIHFSHFKDNIKHFYLKHNILQIPNLFKLELGKFMFKYNQGLLPTIFNKYFATTNTIHQHNTRFSKNNYFLPRKNKTKGQRSLTYLGSKLWTEIPDCLKACFNTFTFSNKYKKFLLKNC